MAGGVKVQGFGSQAVDSRGHEQIRAQRIGKAEWVWGFEFRV